MKNPITRISGVAQHLCCACTIATVFAVCAATKAFGFEATSTMARGYPAPFDIDQPWTPRKAHGHSSSKIGDAPSAPGAKSAEIVNLERPLFAVISIADQHVSIYNNQGLVARSAISTGMPGHPTPKGVFTITAASDSIARISTLTPRCRSCSASHGLALPCISALYPVIRPRTVAPAPCRVRLQTLGNDQDRRARRHLAAGSDAD